MSEINVNLPPTHEDFLGMYLHEIWYGSMDVDQIRQIIKLSALKCEASTLVKNRKID